MTLRDYFGNSLGFEYYFRVPRSYSRRGIFSIVSFQNWRID